MAVSPLWAELLRPRPELFASAQAPDEPQQEPENDEPADSLIEEDEAA